MITLCYASPSICTWRSSLDDLVMISYSLRSSLRPDLYLYPYIYLHYVLIQFPYKNQTLTRAYQIKPSETSRKLKFIYIYMTLYYDGIAVWVVSLLVSHGQTRMYVRNLILLKVNKKFESNEVTELLSSWRANELAEKYENPRICMSWSTQKIPLNIYINACVYKIELCTSTYIFSLPPHMQHRCAYAYVAKKKNCLMACVHERKILNIKSRILNFVYSIHLDCVFAGHFYIYYNIMC